MKQSLKLFNAGYISLLKFISFFNNFPGKLAEKCRTDRPFYFSDGTLNYPRLKELLLEETARAFRQLDDERKLPANVRIGIHNEDFVPCSLCARYRYLCDGCASQLAKDEKEDTVREETPPCDKCVKMENMFTPTTHCLKCLPVVTHTKQGICILVKRMEETLIMDLIPVLPSPPIETVMKFYRTMVTSHLRDRPCGWKKAFGSYFTKDKVLPEDMHDLAQKSKKTVIAKKIVIVKRKTKSIALVRRTKCHVRRSCRATNYILVKLLNYGPRPNIQIRPTQSVDAISKLTSEHANARAFQYAKVLKKLLGIEAVGSYLMKKAFLTNANHGRAESSTITRSEDEHARLSLKSVLESPEVKPFFKSRIDYENKDFETKLRDDGLVLILPST